MGEIKTSPPTPLHMERGEKQKQIESFPLTEGGRSTTLRVVRLVEGRKHSVSRFKGERLNTFFRYTKSEKMYYICSALFIVEAKK